MVRHGHLTRDVIQPITFELLDYGLEHVFTDLASRLPDDVKQHAQLAVTIAITLRYYSNRKTQSNYFMRCNRTCLCAFQINKKVKQLHYSVKVLKCTATCVT
jgi:hypothetical protein